MTILLSGSNKIFYYYGTEFAANNQLIYQTSFDESKGLGKVIREKQLELENQHIEKSQLVVLIKPGNETLYRDFVGVLDEMLINKVTRYVVVDLEKDETAYLEQNNSTVHVEFTPFKDSFTSENVRSFFAQT